MTAAVTTPPPTPPHIVLVCVDEMRADAMGVAGNAHIDTPNLDDLARGGFHFTRAYSAIGADRVDAIAIGNEPDTYDNGTGQYTPEDYTRAALGLERLIVKTLNLPGYSRSAHPYT